MSNNYFKGRLYPTGFLKRYSSALLSITIAILVVIIWWSYKDMISSETLISVSQQTQMSTSESSIFSGKSITINYECEGAETDRWLLYLTTTSNPTNHGSLIIKINDAIQKTFRTRLFAKAAGTYSIPFPKENRHLPKIVSVRLTLAGDNENGTLLYLPTTEINQASFYQISLQPEKGEKVKLPEDVIYPLFIKKFSKSGECRILYDVN